MLNLYPYTNMHELNLDRIIADVQAAEAAAAASAADVAAAAADMAAADAKATLALSTANNAVTTAGNAVTAAGNAATAASNAATAAGNAQTTANAAKSLAEDLNTEKPVVVLRINSDWDNVIVIEIPNLSHVTDGMLTRLKEGRLIFEIQAPDSQVINYYRVLPNIASQTASSAVAACEICNYDDTPPNLSQIGKVVIFATVTSSFVTVTDVIPVMW